MKFNITTDEMKNILEMHAKMKKNSSVISEQADVATKDPMETTLRAAMKEKCLQNGALKRIKSTGQVFYRKPSKQDPALQIDFFGDMTYKFTDGSKNGKWKCDEIAISAANAAAAATETAAANNLSDALLKEKKENEGWMEFSELTGKGYSQLEAEQGKYATEQFKLKNGKVITLYKPKTGAVMGAQQAGMTDEQREFIKKYESKKGKLKLTPAEQASQKYRQIEVPGSREVTGWEDTGLRMWFNLEDIRNISGSASELKTTIENQQIPLDECKLYVDQFFTGYQDDTDIPDFDIVKRKVQRCKVLYSPNNRTGRKNRWGMFSGQKNKIDILSGLVEGQGPSKAGPDAKWRLN